MVPGSYDGIHKCLDSAKKTIELIYETYEHQEFFRTWSVHHPHDAQPSTPAHETANWRTNS